MTESRQLADHEVRLRQVETKLGKLDVMEQKLNYMCSRFTSVETTLNKHNRILYIALGALAILEVLLQLGLIKIPGG